MSGSNSTDDVADGDLGLGDGLRPGGLPTAPCEPPRDVERIPHTVLPVGYAPSEKSSHSGFTTPEDSDDEYQMSLMPISTIQELKDQYANLNKNSKRCSETFPNSDDNQFYDERYFLLAKNGDKCECKVTDNEKDSSDVSKFPVYADVQYGTSIRQQKELFNHSIDELRRKMTNILSGSDSKHIHSGHSILIPSSKQQSCETIAMKLAYTMQEVEDLKTELQTCEQRLDSKYKAIEILKKQAEDAQMHRKDYEKLSRETTIKLAQVEYGSKGRGDGTRVTSLALEEEQDLGEVATHLISAPQRDVPSKKEASKPRTVPLSKYKRMCQENHSLMEVLEARTEELRKVSAQKMAIERENDELLALLDVQERAKYAKTRSASSEENYCTFSSTELAVLGACRCRISGPDPCGCAHAAANLKKEILRMKEEILQYKNRRDEAFQTVDAYRKAFEEQLQRNKALTLQLASLGSSATGKSSKTKSALRWLIGTLNDDEISDGEMSSGPGMSEPDLINYLTEMLHEKKEVLAHQKLAAQILADRVKVLEEKLSQYEKDEPEVFH